MSNISTEHDPPLISLPIGASVALIIISGIPIILNLIFILVCFKALRKEFHHLLILSLCLSDCCLGMSTFWYTLSSFFEQLSRNYISCVFSIYVIDIGVFSTYGLILMISIEKCLTIKSLNFGLREKFNRLKYKVVIGVFLFAFLMSSVLLVFPLNHNIRVCRLGNLMGKHYKVILSIFLSVWTVQFIVIAFSTGLTSFYIWRIFFKTRNKVKSIDTENHVHGSTNDMERLSQTTTTKNMTNICSINSTITKCQIQGAKLSTNCQNKNRTEENLVNEIQFMICKKVRLSRENLNVLRPDIKKTESLTKNNVDGPAQTTSVNHVSTQISLTPEDIMLDIELINTEPTENRNKNTAVLETSTRNNSANANDIKVKRSWEMNAFFTNIVIVISTFILTGPFLGLFWLELLSVEVSDKWQMMSFCLVCVNCIVNPFIYAWRLPEIRQQLWNMLKFN